jgi:hypothetical protein
VYDETNVDNSATGTYGVNGDCTLTITLYLTNPATSVTAAAQTYTVGVRQTTNEAVGIETDASAVATIDLQAQYASASTGPSYTTIGSINGTFAASCLGNDAGTTTSDLNLQTFLNGNVTGTDPYNNGGNSGSGVIATNFTATYGVNTDGTFVGVATVFGSPYTMYGVVANSGNKVDYFYAPGAVGNNLGTGIESCVGAAVGPSTSSPPTPTPTSQSITFNAIASQTVGTNLTLSASSSSGLAVTFASSTTSVCTVSGTSASMIAPGMCTINASQAGNSTYAAAASVSQTFTVNAATPPPTGGSASGPTSVNMSSVDNETVIANNGTGASGLDNTGYSYSANLLGTTVNFNGLTFSLGSAGAKSAATSATIPLPSGSFTTLSFLGTGTYGNQLNQTFKVNYSDGSSVTYTQSMSDWGGAQSYGAPSATFAGESIVKSMAYRVTPSGGTQNGPWYLYGYSFAINPAKTAVSLTLPNNANVLVLSVELSSTPPVSVSLSAVANESAIANNGKGTAGLGNTGYSYSANLLGTTVTSNGQTFTLGSASAPSAVSGKTITLPAGSFNTLSFLGTGIYGNQLNQAFIVTYTDGSSTTFTQSMSDWGGAKSYGATSATFSGESVAATMAYRITPTGATQNGPWYLYGYSFALNPAKTVKSLTLPNNGDVLVLAVNLTY